jgi:hypothetical protein
MPTIQTLKPGDEEVLEAFLVQHATTSMFLRSNSRAVGLQDNGETFQGTYVAAIEDGQIIAVAAHYWNGMVIPQAPVYLEEVVKAAVAQSGRIISGISGSANQVEAVRDILGLQETQICLADVEVWTMDEHRVGLKPIIRKIWVDEWTVPVANVYWRFKWLWLYGFVHPQCLRNKGVDITLRKYGNF